MKAKIIRGVTFASALLAAAANPVQAQTWTNASGTSLTIGTTVKLSGPMDFSAFGIIRKTCTVSAEGTVTSANTVTFTQSTPGFVSTCVGNYQSFLIYPFNLVAGFSSGSPTGEVAGMPSVSIDTPFPCSGSLNFNWYDAPISEARIPVNRLLSPCTIHAGSTLTATTTAGGIKIN